MLLTTAVRRSLRGLSLSDSDKGAAELALTYARRVDAGQDVRVYGPLLLAVLESLLMTPRARAAVLRGAGVHDGGPASPLDQLRERRRAREHYAAPVDPAAT